MTPRFALVVLLAGCSHDVTAVYPMARSNAGTVEVVLNDASRSLTVAIDDTLVVDRERSRRATIYGVPPGPAHVRVASGGGCEQRSVSEHRVVVPPGGVVTVALPGPVTNTGCMVFLGLQYAGLEVGLAALAVASMFVHVHGNSSR